MFKMVTTIVSTVALFCTVATWAIIKLIQGKIDGILRTSVTREDSAYMLTELLNSMETIEFSSLIAMILCILAVLASIMTEDK